jgi:hypothetical protein
MHDSRPSWEQSVANNGPPSNVQAQRRCAPEQLGMVTPAVHKTTIGCQMDPRTQNI